MNTSNVDWTTCPSPECGMPATVSDRVVLEGTEPVEHVRVNCPDGHHFFCPADMLGRAA